MKTGLDLRGVCVLMSTLALLLPRTSDAAGDSSEVKTFITSIHHLYGALDYEHALIQLQLARQQPRGREDEVTLTLYEGIIQYEMGQQSGASAAFRAALLLDLQARLPEKVAPKVEAQFEAMRRKVQQELGPSARPAVAPRVAEAPSPAQRMPPSAEVAARVPSSAQPPETATRPIAPSGEVEVSATVESKCVPAPERPTDTGLAVQQQWRLLALEASLCARGVLDDQATQALREFRARSEKAASNYQRVRLGQEIDQFAAKAGL